MFLSFLFPKKKPPVKLRNESELEQLTMNDDYGRVKSIKDFFVLVFKLVVILLVIALVTEYITNANFKAFVINLIEQNAIGIVLYILTIIGITQLNKKDN